MVGGPARCPGPARRLVGRCSYPDRPPQKRRGPLPPTAPDRCAAAEDDNDLVAAAPTPQVRRSTPFRPEARWLGVRQGGGALGSTTLAKSWCGTAWCLRQAKLSARWDPAPLALQVVCSTPSAGRRRPGQRDKYSPLSRCEVSTKPPHADTAPSRPASADHSARHLPAARRPAYGDGSSSDAFVPRSTRLTTRLAQRRSSTLALTA